MLPIQISSNYRSSILLKVKIPIFLAFRKGHKTRHINGNEDSWIEEVVCEGSFLHIFFIGFRLRVRSKKIMEDLDERSRRLLFNFSSGWQQIIQKPIWN